MSADGHAAIDQAIAEYEIRDYAEQLGYHVGILTDGTIVCEPRPDPNHCETCRAGAADWHDRAPAGSEGGDDCARCGDELTAFTRCQRVVMDEGLSFHLRFLCPKCYAIESAG